MRVEIFIKIIVVLLMLQAISPMCRAFGNEATETGIAGVDAMPVISALMNLASDRPADPSRGVFTAVQKPSHHESCWFAGAHIFEAPVIKSGMPSVPFLVIMVLAVVISLGLLLRRAYAQHWALPYRSPPSQCLLQVFRI